MKNNALMSEVTCCCFCMPAVSSIFERVNTGMFVCHVFNLVLFPPLMAMHNREMMMLGRDGMPERIETVFPHVAHTSAKSTAQSIHKLPAIRLCLGDAPLMVPCHSRYYAAAMAYAHAHALCYSAFFHLIYAEKAAGMLCMAHAHSMFTQVFTVLFAQLLSTGMQHKCMPMPCRMLVAYA